MWGAHEGMGWWIVLGWFWFLLFWGVAFYLILTAVNRFGGSRQRDQDALEILRRRYARGEITKEQYEEIRRDLS